MSGPSYDHIILFTGHMVDETCRQKPRFPPSRERAAHVQILRAIDSLIDRCAGTRVAISSAARGGDILFLEACVARGITYMICLPSSPARFKSTSVEGAAGDWVNRFDRLWGTARAGRRLVMSEETGPDDDADENLFTRHNRWMIQVASQFGTNIHLIALWDGMEGDGCGGTAAMVKYARRMELEITHIDARRLIPSA